MYGATLFVFIALTQLTFLFLSLDDRSHARVRVRLRVRWKLGNRPMIFGPPVWTDRPRTSISTRTGCRQKNGARTLFSFFLQRKRHLYPGTWSIESPLFNILNSLCLLHAYVRSDKLLQGRPSHSADRLCLLSLLPSFLSELPLPLI